MHTHNPYPKTHPCSSTPFNPKYSPTPTPTPTHLSSFPFPQVTNDDIKVHTEGGMKPGQVICKIAADEKASMIVMGTRGMGKVRRTIMGSVSDYVVHHATCPVVVCRHAGDAKA